VLRIFPLGAFLHRSEADNIARALIQEQRRLANSPDLAERFRILWIAARLDQQLVRCTDREIGDLLRGCQERFGVFEAEFGLCRHGISRLLRSPGTGVRGEYIDEDRGGE
jgi:hypothetical protein